MNEETQVEETTTEQESPEQETNEETPQEPTQTEKDYQKMFQDQKARAEKAEAKLKERPLTEKLSVDQRAEMIVNGYTRDEIAYIERNMHGRDLEETLKDPYVTAGIEATRSAKKAEESTPQPTSTVPTFTAEKKPFSALSHKERQEAWSQIISSKTKSSAE